MGGYGSGRRIGADVKTTVEDSWAISTDRLTRDKVLQPSGYGSGTITWRNNFTEEEVCSIGFEANTWDPQRPWLRLHYTKTRTGEKIDYKVSLTSALTPWGATRWWFLCPLIRGDSPCGRRVGKLYLPPGARYYGCRHCYDLTYTSCQESHKFDSMFKLLAKDTGMDPQTVKRLLREGFD